MVLNSTHQLSWSRCIDLISIASFHSTAVACKEPMKKKKRIDPAILKVREDRKKRKIEKEIRRLSKIALQFKPIDENEVPLNIRNTLEARKRPEIKLTDEELFSHYKLQKVWGIYKARQFQQDISMIRRVVKSREIALQELKLESEELYQEAIQLDSQLVPFKCKGPTSTPPIPNYDPVDGDIHDVTKKWELK